MKSSDIGKIGEELVCRYLIKRGYNIISRNYRIKGGEIDIIAENGDYLAFVEVKTRKPDGLTNGFDAVTKRKQRLITIYQCNIRLYRKTIYSPLHCQHRCL